jgi:glycosyltransferase involved in cell wall biosynthesis
METKSSSAEVAIIIPCFNHGAYVEQALNSIFETGVDGLEVILINDGSTDPETLRILDSLPSEKVTVLHQENAGAAAARNHGIRHSVASFFIPLDADNLLYKPYLIQGIQWMKEHPECAVVFGDARIFGEKEGTWCNHPLKYEEIAFENYIDNCALIRKSAWEKAGGYDVKSPVPTREDYILWLDFLLHDFEFHHLPEFCFGYRFLNDSKVRQHYRNFKRRLLIQEYIFQRQEKLIEFLRSNGKLSETRSGEILASLLLQMSHQNLGFGSLIKGYSFLLKAALKGASISGMAKTAFGWPYRRIRGVS